MLLSFDQPKKLRSTKEHNDKYSSDSHVPGTYVPNMSDADRAKWKAKLITGDDPRVEIRKTVPRGVQVAIAVRMDTVMISANGRMIWDAKEWKELSSAISEARIILQRAIK